MLLLFGAAFDRREVRQIRSMRPWGRSQSRLTTIKGFQAAQYEVAPAIRNIAGHREVETTTGNRSGQGRVDDSRHPWADRGALEGRALQPPWFRNVQPSRLRDVAADGRHDGRHFERKAASIAGHLKLSNLCWIYDSNRITNRRQTPVSRSAEDVATRFHGLRLERHAASGDANDLDMLGGGAIHVANNSADRPTLIIIDSHIAYGAPQQAGTPAPAHGEPLGEEEIRGNQAATTAGPRNAKFLVPDGVVGTFPSRHARPWWQGSRSLDGTVRILQGAVFRNLASQLYQMEHRRFARWAGTRTCPYSRPIPKAIASRDSSGKVFERPGAKCPLVDGRLSRPGPFDQDPVDLRWRWRFRKPTTTAAETCISAFANTPWGAVMNGMSLSKIRPFGSGFLIFSDYSRPAIRLAALMEIPVIYVFTHDFDRRRRGWSPRISQSSSCPRYVRFPD